MEEKIVFTVDEVAEPLRISRPTAFKGVKSGEIPNIRVGKRILVPRAALERLPANAGQVKRSGLNHQTHTRQILHL